MNDKSWYSHVEFLVLIVTLLGGFYAMNAKIESQCQRTDRLYEMFIDLIKESRR